MTEAERLIEIARLAKQEGNGIPYDVLTHAMLLVSHGWLAESAILESRMTLDDAEQEIGGL